MQRKAESLKLICSIGALIVLVAQLCQMSRIHKRLGTTDEKLTEIKLLLGSKYYRVDDVLFYLPNVADDLIQRMISCGHFFEEHELVLISKYIPRNAVILDIGANIGNHSLYFASKCHSARIYSFEPVPETFDILKKNVELNHMTDVIKPINIGLSDTITTGKITRFASNNIGATVVQKSKDGSITLNKLDNIDIPEGRVDFAKIDVEGHEQLVLKGAVETLKKYKPVIFIEIWTENFEKVDLFLRNLGYEMKERLPNSNFIYVMKESAD